MIACRLALRRAAEAHSSGESDVNEDNDLPHGRPKDVRVGAWRGERRAPCRGGYVDSGPLATSPP